MRQILLFCTLVSLAGCSSLFGNLRPDFDDGYANEPTTGGRHSEAGQLGGGYYAEGRMGGQGSWMDDANENRARQFNTRNGGDQQNLAYSNAPSVNSAQKQLYKNGERASKSDFIDDTKNDGSLWTSDGQTNYYLTKNKVHTVGDILTITADESLVKDLNSELKRTLSPEERDLELAYTQESMRRKAMGLPDVTPGATGAATDQVASSAASADRSPASEEVEKKDVEIPQATWADVDLKKVVEFKAGDTFMGEVVERYPNGNYKVRGVKRVRYRNGYRMIHMTAIAKNADIAEDDTIPAGKLYEYRLEALR
jgi:flagellar basal body L-ring protein FlgH